MLIDGFVQIAWTRNQHLLSKARDPVTIIRKPSLTHQAI